MALQSNPYSGRQTSHIMDYVGRNVRINRGGPDSIEGNLLVVMADYLAVRAKNGIVYVNAAHVKSITEGKQSRTGGQSQGRTGGRTGGRTAGRTSGYIAAGSFDEVLRRMHQQFVQINQGGPERVAGFVAEVGQSTMLLVANKEVIRIPLFHIKTVSLAGRSGGNNNRNSNDKNNRNNHDKQDRNNAGQSGGRQRTQGQGGRTQGGNRTQGGRSGGQGGTGQGSNGRQSGRRNGR